MLGVKKLLLMLNVEKNEPSLQIAPLLKPDGSIAELKIIASSESMVSKNLDIF